MAEIKSPLKKYIYSLLWTVGLGASLSVPMESASAIIPPEQACEEALRLNTIDALEEYLRLYPDADTACKALALDALNQFGPPIDTDRGDGATGGIDGGYGG